MIKALKSHIEKRRAPFHTPGHKGAFFKEDFFDLDLTEMPDTDTLYCPSGAILEAERAAARLYGAKGTLFSAGGGTLAVQAMLRLAMPRGGRLLCSRRVHVSAVNAMALLGIEPVWIEPRFERGLFCGVSAGQVRRGFLENRDAAGVFVTSPDYFGTMSDIKGLGEVCREFGKLLLIDNAHGAHLKFLKEDAHPLTLGADMTADSAHKTLPVLTGGAFLHINNEKFLADAKGAMALFGSTSPSFPILASLEACVEWLNRDGKDAFDRLCRRVGEVKDAARERGLFVPEGLRDPARIVLGTFKVGLNGERAAEILREKGIEPEYSEGGYVVLIPSPFNAHEDFERLIEAVKSLPDGEGVGEPVPSFEMPEKVMGLRQAVFSEKERVAAADAVGRVAAEALWACPPGVPVVVPGEKIDEAALEFLIKAGILSVLVVK